MTQENGVISHLEKYLKKQSVIGFKQSGSDHIFYAPGKKRGNKAYNYFLYKRFSDIESNIKGLVDIDEVNGFSNSIMLTLTYPHHHDSWKAYKTENKLFFDRLRKNPIIAAKLGKFQYINVVESTRAGVLHCHALLIFEKPLKFKKVNRKSYSNFYGLICDKTLREQIKNCWHHLSDVSAVYSIGGAITYVQKYYKKQFQNLELLIEKAKKHPVTSEEYKALLCFSNVISNNLRMFRASRDVSRARPKDEGADSLDVLLNKCEKGSWEFVGVQDYWQFRDGIKHAFGDEFDFHLMNSIVFDPLGGIVDVKYNAYYTSRAIPTDPDMDNNEKGA